MQNVLIVDDNEQNLLLLEAILSGHGYGVAEATNGVEALTKARSERPDLIISDILMPVMDGFELCREWKRDDRLKDVPFVFYTATYTDAKDQEFVQGLGAERFVIKPQDNKTLLGIIKDVFNEHLAGRPVAPLEPPVDEQVFIKGYNETLIRKLENKMIQVEEANRRLESEMVERERTEKELRRVNRALQTLSLSNLALVRATDEATLLGDVCRILVDRGGYRLAWAGFVEQGDAKTVRPIAGAGFEEGYLEKAEISWADNERGRGPTGTAIRTGRPSICRNLLTDPAFAPWRAEAQKRGYASSMALPLFENDKTMGALMVYAIEPDAFDAKEAKLLNELAADLSFGIATLRARLEHAWAEAERARLAAAVEQAGEIFMVTDPEGTIQYVNPAFTTVTGYTREEAIGKTPRLLKSDKQDPDLYRELWKTISSGKTWTGRIVNRRKDGKPFTEAATISPVLDASGRVANYVAVNRDITEQLQLADQFSQAQKMESVGRLAGGVAHDFSNALTPLLVISGILLKEMDPQHPLYEDIKEMQESGKRCANLTRQLLAFSRSQTWELTILNLNTVVANMVKMLSRVIGEDVELTQFLEPELGNVKADAGQMEQILANLAVNARDAMPNGGKLTIETHNVSLDAVYFKDHLTVAPGNYVMLAVSDTGEGMDEEIKARIFDPFFTTKEKGKGTGLGLSTVYGIVKQSGGNILVYSEPGKGATFKIYLPRVEEEAEDIKTRQKVSADSWQGSETILIVEDEDAVRRVIKRILDGKGYKLLEANSGEQGLELSASHPDPIHLIVTDVIMPGMGGRKMAEQLLLSRPGVKILYVSGYTDNAIFQHGVLASGANFIQKPFTEESFAARIRKVLDGG